MNTIIVNDEIAYECRNHPNYYITKTGKLYSTYKRGCHGKVDRDNPHIVKCGKDKDGYLRVVLSLNAKRKYIKIHTLVVEQFIGKVEKPKVVNHIDGNKQNNNINNLEIVSIKENTNHAHLNGLIKRNIKVNVNYNGKDYNFYSLKECSKYFKDLSTHYLKQLQNNEIHFSMILFKRKSDKHCSEIDAYYNGQLYKTFNSMSESDKFFNMKRGSTSSAFKSCAYRTKVNQYIVTFPNVSTIES